MTPSNFVFLTWSEPAYWPQCYQLSNTFSFMSVFKLQLSAETLGLSAWDSQYCFAV